MSKQDRQSVRTVADLERKYNLRNLGKSFSEALGMSSDARESVDRIESELRSDFKEQLTSLTRDTESIVMAALESYVPIDDYDDFQEGMRAELALMADKLTLDFEATLEQLNNVNADLQTVTENLQKHFEFGADGFTIKAGEYAMGLHLDNDIIRFLKNGQQFGWWDGVNFHTGNIYVGVDEIAQFGNYGFVPFQDDVSDGLDLVRVGG